MNILNTLSFKINRQIKINFDGADLFSDAGLLHIAKNLKASLALTDFLAIHLRPMILHYLDITLTSIISFR